jgi:hypothetical protein
MAGKLQVGTFQITGSLITLSISLMPAAVPAIEVKESELPRSSIGRAPHGQ